MSDLFGNYIVGFPTRWLKCVYVHILVMIPGVAFKLVMQQKW